MTERREAAITDFLSPHWNPKPDKVLVHCYRAVRAGLGVIGPEVITWELGQVRAVAFWGMPSFIEARNETIFMDDGTIQFALGPAQQRQGREGRYVLLLTPWDDESAARARLSQCLGFLYAYHGRNIAYDRLYEQVAGTNESRIELPGQGVENPFHLAVPSLDPAGQRDFILLAGALESVGPDTRRRVDLSLRWLEGAVRDSGADALLRYWVAIEALAMPGSTSVRPLNERLARGYGIDVKEAGREFGMGRIQGVRSALVHGVRLMPIRGEVLSYLAAVYCDLLCVETGRPCPERARKYLRESGVILRTAIDSCLSQA